MVEAKNDEIGSRVECDGYLGTLRYIGPVGNTKGQWLGVDWDDPTRGKHNGTYEGTKYFTSWHSTSGSFIRQGKARFGVSCPQAIRTRYGLINDELVGIDMDNVTSLQKEINAPFMEMVGFSKVNKKQSKFDQLKIVWLRGQCVCDAGKPGELEELCPNLEELDISGNLLNSWEVVSKICCQLHLLTRLNVSENKLPISDDMQSLKKSFPKVSHLVLARMNYNWSDILLCAAMFPSLRELSISFNAVSFLETPRDNSNLMNVTHLTLEGNVISDWTEVLRLGSLPCLEYLNLNDNRIKAIQFPTDKATAKTTSFTALRQLHLSENYISEWQSISELEKLVNLEDLRFRGNPVLENVSVETGRQLIVARISKLKILNGVEIIYGERRGAEFDYLKLFGLKWLETEANQEEREQFIVAHPRFPSLVEKYGPPDIPASKGSSEMLSNVISVEFICPDDPKKSKGIKRKLVKDMEVQKLIGLAQRLFKTGGKLPILSFIQENLSRDEIPLDKPLKQLNFYSIQDGDQVLVRW